MYIKKRFRFWQFSERERAKELVKRVPELIVRPMLLAQIPDLISDPKISVNSLAEFYGYMAEKWFDREESWVPTKVLQNFSERLAVDIYLNRDIRFMERISPSELKQLIVLSMPGIDHWKLTTRSLINRDAEGNYKFSHRSFMEYFFVLAYFKGEKSCLTVKWTDMMITLFESAMNAQLPIVEATSVNIDDFSKTGMFANKPWLWREPSIISLDICVESISNVLETRHNLETHISSANKNLKIWSLKELSLDGLSIFADLGVDLIWYVDRDARNLDPDLTSLTEDPIWKKKSYVTALNNKKFAGASDWRSPTIDEFEWIVIANQSILSNTGTGYLYNEVPYLCSDVTQNQKHIVVSFGNSPISKLSKRLTFIGSRHWKTTTHKVLNIGLHIYEVEDQLQHIKREYQEPWLTVLVSHHGALNLFT